VRVRAADDLPSSTYAEPLATVAFRYRDGETNTAALASRPRGCGPGRSSPAPGSCTSRSRRRQTQRRWPRTGPSRTGIVAVWRPLSGSSRYRAVSPLSQTPPAPAANQSPLMSILAAPASSMSIGASGAGRARRRFRRGGSPRRLAAEPSPPPHPALDNRSTAITAARHPDVRLMVNHCAPDPCRRVCAPTLTNALPVVASNSIAHRIARHRRARRATPTDR
jgi:hypothetical protein